MHKDKTLWITENKIWTVESETPDVEASVLLVKQIKL